MMRTISAFLIGLVLLFHSTQAATPQPTAPLVEIYTIPGCMGCGWAKDLLDENGIPYQEISLRGRPDLYAQMKQRAGGDPDESMTVPRIFINGKYIGGYSDLRQLDLDALKGRNVPASSDD